jgi:nitrogenase molybdenum-cofactor synthesis protein NifE
VGDELDVIYGGERKLEAALMELIRTYHPNAAFVYSTCIVGLIGDDVNAVCRRVAEKTHIPVLPVNSEGFKGTKRDGCRAACDALDPVIGSEPASGFGPYTINILGDSYLAGETWSSRDYFKKTGIMEINSQVLRAQEGCVMNSCDTMNAASVTVNACKLCTPLPIAPDI